MAYDEASATARAVPRPQSRAPGLSGTTAPRGPITMGLTVIYAVCFVLIRAGSRFAPALAFAGLRTAIAGATLLALATVLRQPILPLRKTWPWVLVLALTATAIAYGAMFLSPGRTGVGIASVLGNLQPIFIVGLSVPVLGERGTRLSWLALALGAAGAVLVAAPLLIHGPLSGVSGPVAAVGASSGFAVGSVLVKRLDLRSGLLAFTGWQLLIGSVPLLTASMIFESDEPIVWNARFLAALLFLAIVGTALATSVWYWLVQGGEVGRLAIFYYLVPIFGLGLSAVIYGERIGRAQGIGIALIFVGIGLAAAESWHGATARA